MMKINLCAGGVLLGTLPGRTLLFTKKNEANGRTIAKAVSVPEDALPDGLAPSTELVIVPLAQLNTIEGISSAAITALNAKPFQKERHQISDGRLKEGFEQIVAIIRQQAEKTSEPTPAVEPWRAAAETLENHARELARAGLNEIASAIISLVGAIHGGYEQDFARLCIEAASIARARKAEGLPAREPRAPLKIERANES